MKRFVAAILAILIASPSWAAGWVKLTNNSTVAFARPYPYFVGSSNGGIVVFNIGATSATNILQVVDSSGTVTQKDGPTLSGTAIGATRTPKGIGYSGTTLEFTGGGSGGYFIYECTLPTCGSWTSIIDGATPASYPGIREDLGNGMGSAMFVPAAGSATIGGKPGVSVAVSGQSTTSQEGMSCTVNSKVIGMAFASGDTKLWFAGSDNNNTTLWTNVRYAVSGSAPTVPRAPAFNDGSNCVFVWYDGTDSNVFTVSQSGAIVAQRILAKDVRPIGYYNFNGTTKSWLMDTTGVAYVASAGGAFEDASSTTFDLTPDSTDTVMAGVVQTSSTPIVFTLAGDIWEWQGGAIPAATGGSRWGGPMTGTGPFR